ncbi:TPA: GAF domain-containing protein [Neisseria meningitidis]
MHALHFSASDKAALYREVLPQIESVVADETDWVANLANTAAVLKEAFGWFWVGFYLVDTRSDELVLAPFQGPLACTRIPFGRGVCGQAWAKGGTVVVGDVDADSEHLAQFDETDALYLGELAKILEKRFEASRQAA